MRLIVSWLLPLVAGCSALTLGPFPKTTIPAEIAAPANEKLQLIASAQGAQVYRCDAKQDAPNQFQWTFRAPEANLLDEAGKKVGRHYDGPTWEAVDGSKIKGTIQAQKDAPAKGAIPWLRLATRPDGGTGELGRMTTVLRVNTTGGAAPAGGCNAEERGRLVRVEYTADYYFYAPR